MVPPGIFIFTSAFFSALLAYGAVVYDSGVGDNATVIIAGVNALAAILSALATIWALHTKGRNGKHPKNTRKVRGRNRASRRGAKSRHRYGAGVSDSRTEQSADADNAHVPEK